MTKFKYRAALLALTLLSACGPATDTDVSKRSNSDGTFDELFYQNSGVGFNAPVLALQNVDDGKMLVGGEFTTFKGENVGYLTRLSLEGKIDDTYRSNLGTAFNGAVRALALQNDGKVLVGGDFTTFKSAVVGHLVRLTRDGGLDTSFQAALGAGPNGNVHAIRLNSAGDIFIGGNFSKVNNYPSAGIAKIGSTGALNSAFSNAIGSGTTGTVHALAILSDGKVLIGGDIANFNGLSVRNILRVNAFGVTDASFTSVASSAFNQIVRTVKVDAENKWLLGGAFTNFDGKDVFRFLRLKTDGALDSNYTPAGGAFNNTVRTMLVQGDGKIIVGGEFTAMSGVNRPHLVRLTSAFQVDEDFSTALGSGPSGSSFPGVYALESDSQGKLFVGGSFTSYKGNALGYIFRLK